MFYRLDILLTWIRSTFHNPGQLSYQILILDYLKNAECIKQKAIDEDVCKGFYDQLLEHIESGKSTDDLCW